MTRQAGRMGWLIGAAVWGALAYVGARLLGRGVHIADVRDRQRRAEPLVAQLDAPLWRGTDLEHRWDGWTCPGSAHGECLRGCEPGHGCAALVEALEQQAAAADAAWFEDGGNLADHTPPLAYRVDQAVSDPLAGAILGLAFATDETAARYWLAQCARRGADADTLRDLRAEWDRQHAADVQTLHTDREDPRP
jgi:hypothetical protein